LRRDEGRPFDFAQGPGRGTLKEERKGEEEKGRVRKKGTRIHLTGFLLTC